MHIVHIAAELAPLAKAGGLGDVVEGLSLSQEKQGHNVHVLLPKYSFLSQKNLQNLHSEYNIVSTIFDQENHKFRIYSSDYHGIKLHLIEDRLKLLKRKKIYGYPDDLERFLFFCKASLEYLKHQHPVIDILHIHDWHTGACPLLYKAYFENKGLKIKKIIFTIHNLAYQGICTKKELEKVAKFPKKFLNKITQSQKPLQYNLLKSGIVYSDFVTTVSPTYAQEILTKKFGCGMHHFLRKNKNKIFGILNGIETNSWNPKTDPFLHKNYSNEDSINKILRAKHLNKHFLQTKFHLEISPKPLVANVGRLVQQKAPKLIKVMLEETLKRGGQFILLATPMDPKTKKEFSDLAKRYRKNKNVAFIFEYNEQLSHIIFAATDFLIIPSYFEPCGLTQLYAFRYGTIPIAHKTGGLADTIFDVYDPDIPKSQINGYLFEKPLFNPARKSIQRALKDFDENRDMQKDMISKSMKLDYSWKSSAKKYLALYKKSTK
ncbi:MAG TPA: glycogen/starch synthase [Chlamydiales bacterium]|nr:glycogen/starch synthase [Chlamydiales bacterium]